VRQFTFNVSITVSDEVSEATLREYVHDAIRSHGGAFHPDDPLFGLSAERILVRRGIAAKPIKK
jgi:hypothetical protein